MDTATLLQADPSTPIESLCLDGTWRAATSGSTFEVHDPATGSVLARVADAGGVDAEAAIEAAASAFPEWSARTAYERAAVLQNAHRLMLERAEDLARLMTSEQGKPLRAARTEVRYAADFMLWFAEEAKRVYGRTIPSARSDQRFIVMEQPVGVVGAITPWNYPISMITRKVAPALAAGCTVVLKPAEQTPLCAIAVFGILAEAGVPAGVANLITASDPKPVGEALLIHRSVAKLTFTGSTEVGKFLAARAADQMKRVSLELGGHAPFIVFPDADPVHAAKGAALVKLLNTGQACISPNRLYVHRSIADEFVDALRRRVESMKAGRGVDDGVSVGPLIDESAFIRMQNQVVDAVGKGATVVTGGNRLTGGGLDGGWFFAPTVVTGVTPEMVMYREETFGPIAPVVTFESEAEVIEMANDTRYGLASYVYTKDLARALRTAEALRFGMVGINDINPTSAAAPFGGMGESGLGREGAQEGIREYLETKLVGLSI
ncbi:NAD-dependent succinate-semialdehyde dehydrogenase [Pseudonocardia asaccharolytica]|uniref:NAD-dependent succinate-semialdehyde dehydrogenase n=1 Tax=Pseudonocardia asaccharolytica DSM 44247 = NBRC 16224 TaxID=1123024 RepID=A0A511D7J1_9PSEU|nr:NAD-dependent succinate-semialdehyde dehydrogenase [Pseudonocardia asaccharolytica]GEL20775.1 NAD-dependent succinate-semialdehyde dehydrogenase [Pseudonocardia asaccharolytica DSM 44247 = NBRC 16224]